jgi:hypothetical protein
MSQFDDTLNKINDMDWAWWPLLSTRPARNEKMNNRKVLINALYYGSLIGLLPLPVCVLATGTEVPAGCIGYSALTGVGLFFIGYKLSFARSWNHRAAKLKEIASRAPAAVEDFPSGGDAIGDTPMPFRRARGSSDKKAV